MNIDCLLLTATIKPHNTKGIFEVNQTEYDRYIEYKRCLKYYRKVLNGIKIVLVDNSSSVYVNYLREYASKLDNVEFLHFPVHEESVISGKGYGEGLLISKAIKQSEFIGKSNIFIKITGRYKVHNIKRIFSVICKSDDFWDFIAYSKYNYHNCIETWLFVSTKKYWMDHMDNCYVFVNDKHGMAYECILGKRLFEVGGVVGEIPIPALLSKTSTVDNKKSLGFSQYIIGMGRTIIAGYCKSDKRVIRFRFLS